jgi:hypothetical protein
MYRIKYLIIFVFFLPFKLFAVPCTPITPEQDVLFQLGMQNEDGCYGGDADDTPLAKEILKKLPNNPNQIDLKLPERVNRFKAAAKLLEEQLSVDEIAAERNAARPNPFRLIKWELNKAVQNLNDDIPPEMFQEHEWGYRPASGDVGTQMSLKTNLLEPACKPANQTKPTCDDAIVIAQQTLRYIKLMERFKRMLHGQNLNNFHSNLTRFDNQWKKYATEARSQTPIELALNSWYFSRNNPTPGFVGAPDYQIIFLHPSVVMESVNNAADGSKFKAGIAMEWIGGNWWSWSDGEDAQMETPLGISIISTYADRAGTKDVGHGLMFHYDHVYSLGVTRHGDDTGVFLSIDLQKLFTDKASKLAEVKQKFK